MQKKKVNFGISKHDLISKIAPLKARSSNYVFTAGFKQKVSLTMTTMPNMFEIHFYRQIFYPSTCP